MEDGWKGNRGVPDEHKHGYFGEVDATGHVRKRSFSQAFVPTNQQVQVPPCLQNGGVPRSGRGLLPTPRWPCNGAGGYGRHGGSGNVNVGNGMGVNYTGNRGYNGQMFYNLDPIQNQYINRMLQAPPPRENGGPMGFQGIHRAVPLVRMAPPAGSSMDYSNAPVAVIPPWHKQQEQHHGNLRAHCNNAFPLHGHNQMSSLDSINYNNEANSAIHIAQGANAPMNYANIFAKSISNVVNHPDFHLIPHPTSEELPPPVIPLEIPLPISDSSSFPLRSSRPSVGFSMSLPSDNQNSIEEQTSSKKQETVKPKRLEVKKSTPTASAVLIGKRPGGRHLPTGVIKRPDPVLSVGNRPIDAKNGGPASPTGAWSRYMAEVERYRSQSCSDETPNRPLVK